MIFLSKTVSFYLTSGRAVPRHFRDLGSRVTWFLSRVLIGPFGSREQIDDVSHANEARDPKQ